MGILNVTPDSFSDGGEFLDASKAIEHGLQMAAHGAAIIDIGGESTRPGSEAVPPDEQIARIAPVIKALCEKVDVPISIDTKDVEVAEAALDAGASIINDITALSEERMGELAGERGVPVILMHMLGTPATMQAEPKYEDVVGEVLEYLLARASRAEQFGIAKERIFIDPGIGFGKTLEHNLALLKNIDKFVASDCRVLVGTSRKSFIGKIIGKEDATQRIFGTAATVALCAAAGVSILRVHDVAQMVDVVKVPTAIGPAMTSLRWPDKEDRESFEIYEFIKFYERLSHGRHFKVVSRGDLNHPGPDWVVQELENLGQVGVELVSVYLNDRSVPGAHKKVTDDDELTGIPCKTEDIDRYEKRLLEAVADKIEKAKKYNRVFPMILSVYVNEYISIFMDERWFESMVQRNENLFDRMAPFDEIVFWPLPNEGAFSVRPS